MYVFSERDQVVRIRLFKDTWEDAVTRIMTRRMRSREGARYLSSLAGAVPEVDPIAMTLRKERPKWLKLREVLMQ